MVGYIIIQFVVFTLCIVEQRNVHIVRVGWYFLKFWFKYAVPDYSTSIVHISGRIWHQIHNIEVKSCSFLTGPNIHTNEPQTERACLSPDNLHKPPFPFVGLKFFEVSAQIEKYPEQIKIGGDTPWNFAWS